MKSADLERANTPDEVLCILREMAHQYACDAVNLDACEMRGAPWAIISRHLEQAAAKIEKNLVTIGYPLAASPRDDLNDKEFVYEHVLNAHMTTE